MKKVMLITNVPTPYRVPLFERLDSAFREAGWELIVVFGERSYLRRKYELKEDTFNFKHLFLHGGQRRDTKNPEATVFLYGGLMRQLRDISPDHVIVSGFSPATIRVWWWSVNSRKTFSVWSGTIPRRGKSFGFARTLVRRWIARRADGFIAYGTEAKRYLMELGVPAEKIDIATNTVNTIFFRKQTEICRIEEKHNQSRPFTFTFIGYLVPRKKVDKILHGAAELSRHRKDFHIRIIGDGPEREPLESLAGELMVSDRVEFAGHKQTAELPSILAQTDVFLFQTGFDIWGLVLNEAMAAGIACIASPNGGTTLDLIRDGENGFQLDYSDTGRLAERMKWCIEHPSQVRAMGILASSDIEDLAGMDNAVRIFISNTIRSSGIKS